MPRGGRRAGTPGANYGNRTDLAKPKVMAMPGQTYGEQAQQVRAQRSMPMARPTTDAVPTGGGPRAASGGGSVAPPAVLPGQVTPLGAPTERPGEPVTAGVPVGAGPGIEALGALGMGGDDTGMQLRALYTRFPTEDLRRVIEMLDTDDGSGL